MIVALSLFLSILLLGSPAWPSGMAFGPAVSLAAPGERSPHPFLHTVRNTKAKSRSSGVAYIRNLRHHRHPTYTRLVLDLARNTRVAEARDKSGKTATITLYRSALTRKARAKLHGKQFPQGIRISETGNQAVEVSLNLSRLQKYTVTTLKNPHRLVLDLYYSPNGQNGQSPQPPPPVVTAKPRPQKPVTERLVVIDPGHGGKDPGAIGRRGTKEKHVTLVIGKLLKELIQNKLGARVLLTREKDRFLSLEERVQFANKKKADLFISIHVNSHPQAKIRGLELYHFGKASDPRALEVAARENGTPLDQNAPAWQFILADKLHDQKIDESRDFAWTTRQLLVKGLRKHYTVKDHGVKTAPFYVLRYTTMPSILAEVAFVSNPTDEKRLRNSTFQRRMAEGIFNGIKRYLTSRQF